MAEFRERLRDRDAPWAWTAWHLRTEHGWSWRRLSEQFANPLTGCYPTPTDVRRAVETRMREDDQ